MISAVVQIELRRRIVIESKQFLSLKNQTTIRRSVTPFVDNDDDDGIAMERAKKWK